MNVQNVPDVLSLYAEFASKQAIANYALFQRVVTKLPVPLVGMSAKSEVLLVGMSPKLRVLQRDITELADLIIFCV